MIPFLYPEDYGAIGDGVADDWNACQKAINACLPSQTVFFSQTYGISQPLQVWSSSLDSSSEAVI